MQALLCDTSVQTAEDSELLAEQELLSILLFGQWQLKKTHQQTHSSPRLHYELACWMCLSSLAMKNNGQYTKPTAAPSWLLCWDLWGIFSFDGLLIVPGPNPPKGSYETTQNTAFPSLIGC